MQGKEEQNKCVLVEDFSNSQEDDSNEILTNANECCSPSTATSECNTVKNSDLNHEQPDSIKEAAPIELINLQDSSDGHKVQKAVDVEAEETDNDRNVVLFGTNFTGNIRISSAPDDIDINKQHEQATPSETAKVVCNTVHEPSCNHVIIQDTKPD